MKTLIYLLVFFFSLSSCVKNNPDPSWIKVNKWSLITNLNATSPQGVLTESFTDAYVFVDGKMMGIFEVPFKIPLLKSGSVNIKIYPVIKNNGISATKKIYPFMSPYDLNVVIEQNKTLEINPVTNYVSATQFWIEDFEDATIKIENDVDSKVQIHSDDNPSVLKFGNYCGKITLNASDSLWLGRTTSGLKLPIGKEVYLEIDYHNTNSLETGLVVVTSTGVTDNRNILINKQTAETVQWKKIYIDLKELVSYSSTATSHEISFKALFDAGLPSSDIYIDNIKIVHF